MTECTQGRYRVDNSRNNKHICYHGNEAYTCKICNSWKELSSADIEICYHKNDAKTCKICNSWKDLRG